MLFDTHAHLDMEAFAQDLEEVFLRAREAGLSDILTVGIDLPSSLRAVEIARRKDWVHASVGFHPHNAEGCALDELDRLVELASDPQVVAWGEIGLDFYRGYCPAETQKAAFRRQLEIAAGIGLPVIIHDRDAHQEVLSELRRLGSGSRHGVIHCFSGDAELAMTLIDMGYYISIPGTVTFPKATQVKEVARRIPLDALLIETDAPYLAPIPKRGKRNEPAFVRHTAKEIAALRKIPEEELARATTANARRLFRLEENP